MSYLTNYLEGVPENTGMMPSQVSLVNERTNQATGQVSTSQRDPRDIQGDILRAQWNDWENRFQWAEDLQYANVLDPQRSGELRRQAIDETTAAANNAQDRAANRTEMLRSRFNISATPEEQAQTQRMNAVSGAANRVSARNQTRGFLQERDMQLLAG